MLRLGRRGFVTNVRLMCKILERDCTVFRMSVIFNANLTHMTLYTNDVIFRDRPEYVLSSRWRIFIKYTVPGKIFYKEK